MEENKRKMCFHKVCDMCHQVYKLEEEGALILDNESFQMSYDKALVELYSALQKFRRQERRRQLK
jgi:hypothetical protein